MAEPHPQEMKGKCPKCGRERTLHYRHTTIDVDLGDIPVYECGTCIAREERRSNTKSMWGRGRRGY